MSFSSYLNCVITQATNGSFYVISALYIIGRVYQIILFRRTCPTSIRHSVHFNCKQWNTIMITYQIYNNMFYNVVALTSSKLDHCPHSWHHMYYGIGSNNMACTLQPDVNQEPCTHPHSVLCLKIQKCNESHAQFVEIYPVLF